ncbi:tRNA pseudouridine synthase A [Bacteroidia bacterium]|nr:tRNA pseudouridine synthase A [Bacteroidia bacterium]
MKRYFIELAYNGQSFFGWQTQPSLPSVQETLEQAFSLILRRTIHIVGAGRTDTGVHAKFYVAHFDTELSLTSEQLLELCRKLNAYLRHNIVIYQIFEVDLTMHARFSALSRTYQYFIRLHKDPFETEFTYLVHHIPNIERMNEACRLLLQYTDFSCFSKSRTQTKTNLCVIKRAFWLQEHDRLVFTIEANRFLRNMVRAIVGTLLEVGFAKLSMDDFRRILEAKDRSQAGESAPAKALFLTDIQYPELRVEGGVFNISIKRFKNFM